MPPRRSTRVSTKPSTKKKAIEASSPSSSRLREDADIGEEDEKEEQEQDHISTTQLQFPSILDRKSVV